MRFVTRPVNSGAVLDHPRPSIDTIDCDTRDDPIIRITPNPGRGDCDTTSQHELRQVRLREDGRRAIRATELRSVDASETDVLDLRQQLIERVAFNDDRISVTNSHDERRPGQLVLEPLRTSMQSS